MLRYFLIFFLILSYPAKSSLDILDRNLLSQVYSYLQPADFKNLSFTSKRFLTIEVPSSHLATLDYYYCPERDNLSPLMRSRVCFLNLLRLDPCTNHEVMELISRFKNAKKVLLPGFVPATLPEILFVQRGIKSTYPYLEVLRLCQKANKLNLYPFLERLIYGSGYLTQIGINHLNSFKRIPQDNCVIIFEILKKMIPKNFQFKENSTMILMTNNNLHAVSMLSVLLTELSYLNTAQLNHMLFQLESNPPASQPKNWESLLNLWIELKNIYEKDLKRLEACNSIGNFKCHP